MALEERDYRTLVVTSSEKFKESLRPLFAPAHCRPVLFADSVASAKRLILENTFDLVIVSAPLPDEPGTRFAIDLSLGRSTVCLLFIRADVYAEVRGRVSPFGVFTLPKPTSSTAAGYGLDFLVSARERLRNLEKKTQTLEEKMQEIRVINRAKLLLIENRNMTESEAHRYLEKQAMDRCVPKREVADEIVSIYSPASRS